MAGNEVMTPQYLNDPNEADVIPLVPLTSKPKSWNRPTSIRGHGAPLVVADGVIEIVRNTGFDLRLSGGDLHVQENRVWRIATRTDIQWLRCLIQQGCEAVGDGGRLSLVNASWRRLLEHPGLFVRNVTRDHNELVATTYPPRICPVNQWAQAMLVHVELGRVSRRDLLCAFRGWWREQTDDNVRLLSGAWLLNRLRIACPYVTDLKVEGILYVGGVHLTEQGLGYWDQQAADAGLRYGGLIPTSTSVVGVNRLSRESRQKVKGDVASITHMQAGGVSG